MVFVRLIILLPINANHCELQRYYEKYSGIKFRGKILIISFEQFKILLYILH